MTNEELKQLDALLTKFEAIEDHPGSLYGRNMDVSLAASVRTSLPAYGLRWIIRFKTKGEDVVIGGYYSLKSATESAEYYMRNPEELRTPPLSYTIE